jgi:hypothetical protein
MRLSFNQPYFLPWGGIYARMLASDAMVLLDDTRISNGFTYVNRNRLKGPEGEVWISVPLRHRSRGKTIRSLEIHDKAAWAEDFLETLRHFYGKSLYFDRIQDEIRAALVKPGDDFLETAVDLLEIHRSLLSIDSPIHLQSNLGIRKKGIDLLVSLAVELGADTVVLPYFSRKALDWPVFLDRGIRVRFLRYDPPQHPQFWGPFLSRLSALDLLLCCGPSGRAVIEQGIALYDFDP